MTLNADRNNEMLPGASSMVAWQALPRSLKESYLREENAALHQCLSEENAALERSLGNVAWEALPRCLKEKNEELRKQVEYYLSDKNLENDKFFHECISADPEGWLDMQLILDCKQVKAMKASTAMVLEALRWSTLETWVDGDRVAVRRPPTKPLPKLIHRAHAPPGVWLQSQSRGTAKKTPLNLGAPRFQPSSVHAAGVTKEHESLMDLAESMQELSASLDSAQCAAGEAMTMIIEGIKEVSQKQPDTTCAKTMVHRTCAHAPPGEWSIYRSVQPDMTCAKTMVVPDDVLVLTDNVMDEPSGLAPIPFPEWGVPIVNAERASETESMKTHEALDCMSTDSTNGSDVRELADSGNFPSSPSLSDVQDEVSEPGEPTTPQSFTSSPNHSNAESSEEECCKEGHGHRFQPVPPPEQPPPPPPPPPTNPYAGNGRTVECSSHLEDPGPPPGLFPSMNLCTPVQPKPQHPWRLRKVKPQA